MIISVIGYMGSGKSHISKLLSLKTGLKLFDLDKEISKKNNLTIPEIFKKHGEIYFRRQEKEVLTQILTAEKSCILSLGGGTPVYYDNMELINQNSTSIFLRTSVGTLVQRLMMQKEKRPLIAHLSEDDLPEFIAKHLFERNIFYSKSKFTVDTDGKTPENIVKEILNLF